jgi:hypothetical protein
MSSPVKQDGTFDAALPPNASPTQIFIVKVLDVAGAVLGAGILNGPALAKGFLVDVPVDTLTSFKANVLDVIAKKGVPGLQNYLNVLDAFIDAELSSTIALETAAAADLNNIVSALADALIAGENVIVAALEGQGIKVDISVLTQRQLAAVSGFEGMVTNESNKLVSSAKNLVASFEAASANAVASIDKAIFNAIVNGSVAFNWTFQNGLASGGVNATLNFGASKAMFSLLANIAVANIMNLFQNNPKVMGILQNALATFQAQIAQAKSGADLNAAKAALTNVLLATSANAIAGGNALLQLLATVVTDLVSVVNNVEATLNPLAQALATALTQPSVDAQQAGAALDQFDKGVENIANTLETVTNNADAAALAGAIGLVHKLIVL